MMDGSVIWPSTWAAAATVAATAITTVAVLVVSKVTLWPTRGKILPSPLKTVIPNVPAEELQDLVYQPDQFPGARDIQTPYGSVRVYEFGPEDGERVLFIHGISTACVTLGPIANGLVKRGCRVMLFDLFGRGFSDGVGDLPHDARLYVSQILHVLASSPHPWTGSSTIKLRVVGYSLGGGIAVHFANAFPNLVSSLILLAPAGMIRAQSFGTVSRFVFSSGLVPERLLALLTKRRLQQPIASAKQRKPSTSSAETPQGVEVAAAEAADPPAGEDATPLERRVLLYVRWMVENHIGFVPAFMSSIRHAPLTEQHDSWRQLARRQKGTTFVMLARDDEIIDPDDYAVDALPLVGGKDHVRWKVMPGGHDFVMTHSQLILKELDDYWGK